MDRIEGVDVGKSGSLRGVASPWPTVYGTNLLVSVCCITMACGTKWLVSVCYITDSMMQHTKEPGSLSDVREMLHHCGLQNDSERMG